MKIILIMLCLGAFLGLSGCFSSEKSVEKAKEELLGESQNNQEQSSNSVGDTQADQNDRDEDNPQETEQKSKIQVIPLSEEQFLDFDTLDISDAKDGEIEISGQTNTRVQKIEVDFSNPTSDYPDDFYTLETYEPDDGVFIYRASSKFQVLDFGENNYIFRAYAGDSVSETKITIPLEDTQEDEENTGAERALIGFEDNLLALDFPTNTRYGEPIKLGEASFTYSGVKGFEARRETYSAPSCETITDFLRGRINTWFYWNTCRDITKDLGIYFNVLRLEGEKYIYERHYLDFKHNLYGVYELETGKGVTQDTIAEKNNELKEREFSSLEVVDMLMRDIVTS